MMNAYLIESFKEKVYEHNLILHIYRYFNGKNKWGCICSSMDWIEVGLSGIDVSSLERSNTHQASVKVMTFLSCIDVMWEGIQQLHRVFFDTKGIPFEDEHNIFHKEESDNDYWKEIRATFLAHPTNLDGATNSEKRFASWSGGGFGTSGDFSVIVYSNDPAKNSEIVNISFDEIISFASSRYNYLNRLMDRIDDIILEYCTDWRKRPIHLSGNPVSDIGLLLEANAERLNNDFYEECLLEMRKAFEITTQGKNASLLQEYCSYLKDKIHIIYDVLQNMDLEYEMEYHDFIDLNYVYENQLINEPEKGMLEWALGRLNTPLGQYVDLYDWDTFEELQVLVRAGWWKYRQQMSQKVN